MNKTEFFLIIVLTLFFLGLAFGCSLSGEKEQKYDTTSINITIGLPGQFSAKAVLGTYADVVRVTMEVVGEDKYGVVQDPLVPEQDLVHQIGGEWTGTITGLPVGPVLTFRARGYNSGDVEIFSGVTTQVMTGVSDSVIVVMDPESYGVPITFPRVWRIRLPIEIINDTDANIEIGVEGNADESLSYEFSNSTGGGVFTPNPDTIVLPGSGNGTFNVTYTAPTEVGIKSQTVKVINSQGNSVEMDFDTDVVEYLSGDINMSTLFAPVVVSLNGKRTGAVVTWTAVVEDDIDPLNVTYNWEFSGSSSAGFLNASVNPAELAGYNETVKGNITLSVTDGDGLTSTVSFALVEGQFPDDVLDDDENRAPVLNPIDNQSVEEGQLLAFIVSVTDPDSDPVTLSATNLPEGATFDPTTIDPTTGVFAWTPGYDQAGTYPDVHFEVTDGLLTDSEDITITVIPVNGNMPPNVDAGLGQSITLSDEVNLSGTTDDGGDGPGPLSTTWSKQSGPGTVTFGDETALNTTASFSNAGIYVLKLIADDGQDTAEDIVTITVFPDIGNDDLINDIAVDSAGNVFVVGYIEGASSGKDRVTCSYDMNGNLRWFDLMGPNDGELTAVAVDPADDSIYVVGYHEFTPGNKDWLIRKYANSGGETLEAWRLAGIGGEGEDIAHDVAVDSAGNVYVVGVIYDPGAPSGNENRTIYSFGPDGTENWNYQLGGEDSVLTGVAVDPETSDPNDDKIIAVGYYIDYKTTTSGKDWLIRKYDQAGTVQSTHPLHTTMIGGQGEDIAYDVAVDSEGNVVIAGTIEDFVNGSGQDWTTYSFDREGNLNWSDQLGSKDGVLKGVGIDPADDSIYVVGYYTNFVGSNTGKDWLLRKYESSGPPNVAAWRPPGFGGAGEDIANAVAVDPLSGKVWIGGYGTNFVNDLSNKDARLMRFNSTNVIPDLDIQIFYTDTEQEDRDYSFYLLMGQSNMVGRDVISPNPDQVPHPRVFQLTRTRQWVLAIDPLEHNGYSNGVGLGLTFGKTMADANPDVEIGLIPTARGGTSITQWERGDELYEDAINRALTAVARGEGTIVGVIWHQGESNSKTLADAEAHAGRLKTLVENLREDLGIPDLPFVCGNLYTGLPSGTHPYAPMINEVLTDLPNQVPDTYCVSSDGLTDKGDNVHFDSASQREFGSRYAAGMIYLQQ